MTVQHAGLTLERWAGFDITRRVLMISNELHRASKWTASGHEERRLAALERALALTDLTIALERRPTWLNELLRFRDCVAAAYVAHEDAPDDRALLRALLLFDREAARQIPFVAA